MVRRIGTGVVLALVLSVALAVRPAQAQTLVSGSITTAGADCSVNTRCVSWEMPQVTSVAVRMTITTSVTMNWEASLDATNDNNGTWFGVPDDVAGAGTATATGTYVFANPGYRRMRARASAISGNVTVVSYRGFASLRSTATVSGGSGGSSASDDAAFTIAGAGNTTVMAALADEAGPDVVDEGDSGAVRMTLNRILLSAIANPDGTLRATIRDVTGANDALNVAITTSAGVQVDTFGGGQQYAEGATAATITGTACMVEDAADTLRPCQGSIANGLKVDVTRVTGNVAVTNAAFFAENTVNATVTGVPIFVEDSGNTFVTVGGTTAGGMKVAVTSVAGAVDTELPAASAPGLTGISTPTAPAVINYNYCSNGTTWDACIGTPDPCAKLATTTTPISVAATRTVIISAVSAKKNYICHVDLVAGAAEIANIVEGTGTTCQTSTAALLGSTTAANGLSFAINGGIAIGSGSSSVLVGKTANVDTCLVNNSTGRVSGTVTWVQN